MSIILGFGSAARGLNSLRDSQSGNGSETGNWAGPLFLLLLIVTIIAFVTYPAWTFIFKKRK